MRRSNFFFPFITFLTLITFVSINSTVASQRKIHLVNTGWHVGIIVPIDSVLKRNLPEALNFLGKKYLEIGWGDKTFYQTSNPSFQMAFDALLKSTSSVIHLYGFNPSIHTTFKNAEIIELHIEEYNYIKLLYFIHKSLTRNADGSARLEGPGLYGKESSSFYAANGKFHLFNTCNTWVGNAIQAAGMEINSYSIITSDSLMDAVRNSVEIK
tara:strand:- start:2393 stop:3028 length:636 start_codon:yes stop_codon:yes gene_type:complete